MVTSQGSPQDSPRQYVRNRGIKVTWIARQLGVPHSVVSDVLARKKGIIARRRWGPRIAQLLGVPLESLFPELGEEVGDDQSQREHEAENVEGQERQAPGPLPS